VLKSSFIVAITVLLDLPLASAQERPDFSGVWMPDRTPGYDAKGFPRADWPYTELGQQWQDAYQAEFDPIEDDPAFFCIQPGMPSSMTPAAPFPVEIIQRDQDLTLFFEAWSQYRKIHIDGFARPDPLLNTRMGYAVGRWEDATLVVEGTLLTEQTMGRTLMSDQASFVERLHVETGSDGKRRLISDITFTDPVIYREPIQMRGVWIDSPDVAIMEYVCTEELYTEHLDRVRHAKTQ
jgi:hypothetical protein